MTNEARTGMTVASLAKLLAQYAKDYPDAVVKFTSSESGGYWPKDRRAMGVFTGEQVAAVDATRCGGDLHMQLSLLSFDGQESAHAKR